MRPPLVYSLAALLLWPLLRFVFHLPVMKVDAPEGTALGLLNKGLVRWEGRDSGDETVTVFFDRQSAP